MSDRTLPSLQAEGRAGVKAAGRRTGGPKPKLTPAQQREIRQRLADGETAAPLAVTYNVSRQTIDRLRPASTET